MMASNGRGRPPSRGEDGRRRDNEGRDIMNQGIKNNFEGEYEMINDFDEEFGEKKQFGENNSQSSSKDWEEIQTSDYVFKSRTLHEQFIQNLPRYDVFAENFQFTVSKNQQLTNEEINELYDAYGIMKTERVGRRGGYSLAVAFQSEKKVKKCALLFVRQAENGLFNVIRADAENSTEVNWSRLIALSGAVLGASFIGMLVGPGLGSFTLATSSLALAGKYMGDFKQHQEYQNLVVGYMIRELEKTNYIVFRDTECFLREGTELISVNVLDYYGGI